MTTSNVVVNHTQDLVDIVLEDPMNKFYVLGPEVGS